MGAGRRQKSSARAVRGCFGTAFVRAALVRAAFVRAALVRAAFVRAALVGTALVAAPPAQAQPPARPEERSDAARPDGEAERSLAAALSRASTLEVTPEPGASLPSEASDAARVAIEVEVPARGPALLTVRRPSRAPESFLIRRPEGADDEEASAQSAWVIRGVADALQQLAEAEHAPAEVAPAEVAPAEVAPAEVAPADAPAVDSTISVNAPAPAERDVLQLVAWNGDPLRPFVARVLIRAWGDPPPTRPQRRSPAGRHGLAGWEHAENAGGLGRPR